MLSVMTEAIQLSLLTARRIDEATVLTKKKSPHTNKDGISSSFKEWSMLFLVDAKMKKAGTKRVSKRQTKLNAVTPVQVKLMPTHIPTLRTMMRSTATSNHLIIAFSRIRSRILLQAPIWSRIQDKTSAQWVFSPRIRSRTWPPRAKKFRILGRLDHHC